MANKLEFLVGEMTLAAHSADIENACSAMAPIWDGEVVITPIPGEGLAFRLGDSIYSSPEFMAMLKNATASASVPSDVERKRAMIAASAKRVADDHPHLFAALAHKPGGKLN